MSAGAKPTVPAGRMPLAGSHPRRSVNTRISTRANQKPGSEIPSSENTVTPWSSGVYGRTAEASAIGRARAIARARASRASRAVGGSASPTISDTGRRSRNERSWPVTRAVIVETYWTGRGWSRPSCARSTPTSAVPSCSGETSRVIGSPGASTIIAKVMTVTPTRIRTAWRSRRTT